MAILGFVVYCCIYPYTLHSSTIIKINMDEDKIIKMVKKKFPVLNVVMDLESKQEGNEKSVREIDGYNITVEFAPSTVLIRKIEEI